MLSIYDNLVIVLYFVLMIVIGIIFRRFNHSTSDYFRSGGSMMWQLVGATTFVSFISAVTYTGAAGKAYETGTFAFTVYFANGVGFFLSYLYFSYRFRQTRAVTAIEIVRERFGKVNEQFFTWMVVPFGVIHGGVWLYSLGIIISTVFAIDINVTILSVGLAVVVMSLLGGSWAVIASDFMQLLIILPIAVVMAFLSIDYVGGVSSFVDGLPSHHTNWSELADSKIVWLWVVASFCKQTFSVNNTNDGYRFLAVKDSNHARKAALMTSILFFTVSIVWFIPPLAAAIVFPDISQVEVLKPLGEKAVDGVYLAMGLKLLPDGLIGIMICAIFAATMSSMDSTLNRNAGIFVRNFYKPILRKAASDKELLLVSYFTTAVLGALVILAAIFFSRLQGLKLFDLNMKLASMVSLPFMIPLLLGIVFKNTPRWAGWSTVVLGMLIAYVVENHVDLNSVAALIGISHPLSQKELIDGDFIMTVFSIIVICSTWFLGSRFFAKSSPPEYHESVDKFFDKVNTPVDYEKEHGDSGSDARQYKVLGYLSLGFGGFVSLLLLIPNDLVGRASILFVGGFIASVGAIFLWQSRKVASSRNTVAA